jgi:predicted nuclease with TOPRIM domain
MTTTPLQQILKDLRETANDLEVQERASQLETDRLERALVSLTAKFVGVQQENSRRGGEVHTLSKEVAQLREYVHQLVSHIKRIEVGLASLSSETVAQQLHAQNNSWLVPDAIERRIYEEAVDQMSDLIQDIVRLPEDQSKLADTT